MRAITRMLNPLTAIWNRKEGAGKRRRRRRRHGARTTTDPKIASLERLVVEEIEVAGPGPAFPVAAPKPKRRLAQAVGARVLGTWVGLWLLIVLAALFARAAWPVDETRTLAFAWEMWSRGGALVPYLNGVPYVEPPLLYWLIAAGWAVFGVSEWWPRLVPPLFGLGSMAVAGMLARRLWPEHKQVARYAPILLLGTACWSAYLTLALPDMLLVFFVLLAALGMATLWRGQRRSGWSLLGLALGGGVLAAGPGVFLYVGPLALLAPLWAQGTVRGWYADIGKALVVAAGTTVVALLLFTGNVVGSYLGALLGYPLPGPGVEFFASTHPWWWYLALLPVLALPWSIFPLVWMRAWHIRRERLDPGFSFCLFWGWSAIVLLSLLGSKQPQFLLPVLPAFVLGAAYLLLSNDLLDHKADSVLSSMGFPIVVIGGVLAAVPGLPRVEALPGALWEMRTGFIGMAIAGIGILMAWLPLLDVKKRIMNITVGGVGLLVIAMLGIASQFDKLYAVNEVGVYLASAERQQRPIAHVGPYDGRFHFAGRLRARLAVVEPDAVRRWCTENADGVVVTYGEVWQPRVAAVKKPVFEAPFRDQRVYVWEARTILAGN